MSALPSSRPDAGSDSELVQLAGGYRFLIATFAPHWHIRHPAAARNRAICGRVFPDNPALVFDSYLLDAPRAGVCALCVRAYGRITRPTRGA